MRKCQVIYLSAGVTVLYVSASLYTQYAVHEIVRKCMHEQISTLVNTTHHSHVDFGSGSEGHPHTHTHQTQTMGNVHKSHRLQVLFMTQLQVHPLFSHHLTLQSFVHPHPGQQ